MSLSPVEFEVRKKAFFKVMRPLTAWQAGRLLRRLTPGIDWRGTPKGRMASHWADPNSSYPALSRLTLEQLEKAVTQHIREQRHG